MQPWTPLKPWIETFGVVLLGGVGVSVGRWFSRLAKPYWTLGYVVPLALILLLGLAYRFRALEFVPPFSWLMAGRTEFGLTALIGTMVLTTPLSRLPRRRDRVAIRVLMMWVVFQVAAWPFLVDHYVAVLEVDDQTVTVGDPLNGRQRLTHAEFAEKWRFVGVTLNLQR